MGEDQSKNLAARVRAACEARRPLRIVGGDSKAFYGRGGAGDEATLSLAGHQGVISYEPSELMISARAGTPLSTLETVLDEGGQMLAFEPPRYRGGGSLGGAIACGLSGPRRPYAGAARDFVLGVRCLNGRGEDLRFGGQVMKNVAGYDLSRLLTGALGTLGVLLEVSIKVMPKPEQEITLALDCPAEEGFTRVERWLGETLPVSAAAHDGERLYLRLSGAASTVAVAAARIGGVASADLDYWRQLRDHEIDFFGDPSMPLWRFALPVGARPLRLAGPLYQEWGGRLRWLRSEAEPDTLFAEAARLGGHASLFRGGDRHGRIFQPLPAPLMALHRRIKTSLDPEGILNPGLMYAEL